MEFKNGAYFISGIDTDCGKTYVTGRLAAYLRHRGVSVITQKPVQTGCETVADDLVEHRKAMGCGMLPEDREGRTCSYLFHKNVSPGLAASLENKTIDIRKIDDDTAYLLSRYSVVLVEGDGGLMVPLADGCLTIDYVAERSIPLVLVATSKIGSINHALLSIEVCKQRGVNMQVLVFDRLPQYEQAVADYAFDQLVNYAKTSYPDVKIVDFRSSDSFWGKI